jgi:DNA repair protein RadD
MEMLRDYQMQALDACIKSENGGLVIAPTGAGKSHIIAALCQHFKDKKVLVLTPRIELVKQNSAKIESDAKCLTVNKAHIEEESGDILIIDECHSVKNLGGMYQKLMKNFKVVYGFTATPYRTDIGPITPKVFSKLIYTIDRAVLVEKGYLSRRNYVRIPPKLHVNVEDDAKLDQVSLKFCPYTSAIVEDVKKRIKGSAIVYVCDLGHADVASRHFPNSKIISGKTPPKLREQTIEEFKKGGFQFLINCELLTTGFDWPPLSNIIILRPTSSLALYEQIIGRGDRVAEDKDCNNIWDYTINTYYFNEAQNSRNGGKRLNVGKTCPKCFKQLPVRATYCHICGMFMKAKIKTLNIEGAEIVQEKETKKYYIGSSYYPSLAAWDRFRSSFVAFNKDETAEKFLDFFDKRKDRRAAVEVFYRTDKKGINTLINFREIKGFSEFSYENRTRVLCQETFTV